MKEWERLEIGREGHVTYLFLNRPEKLNALDERMIREFTEALTLLEDDDETKVLVITGKGRAFCAGRDLTEKRDFLPFPELKNKLKGTYLSLLYSFPKPVVASVNGLCLGSGLDLALFSDIRIATEDALFGYPEISLGMVVGSGGIEILCRLVGLGEASYLVLTGRRIDGRRAFEIGLVNCLCSRAELTSLTGELAQQLAQAPLETLVLTKQILRQSWELSREVSRRNDALISTFLRLLKEYHYAQKGGLSHV